MRKMKIERDIASRREAQLCSHISELKGVFNEQNTRMEEYYDHLKGQESEIESLKSENGR